LAVRLSMRARINGGFGPGSLPLFHAGRRGLAIGDEESPSTS
jgi:hypothetical protein